jgi:hypothetical protein
MLLLGFGVSRGLRLDTLCSLIDYAPHQLSDPARMVPFATSLHLARALPANIGRLRWPVGAKAVREINTCPMPALGAASSLTYQPAVAEGNEPLFPPGTIVLTSFFGGGLYTLPEFR